MGTINKRVAVEFLMHDKLSKEARKAKQEVEGLGQQAGITTGQIKALVGSFLGAGALQSFAGQIIEVRAELQMLEKSFSILLGGNGVEAFMRQMKGFAVESPLSLKGIGDAAQTLLGFGIEAEKVMPVIQQLGDISMGNEERFRGLALVYAQVQSTGKLMGQDFMQLVNNGFNPLQEIARTTGKTIAALKDEMSNGAITADIVADAFRTATAAGGQFHGMTQQQAEGLAGLQAQLEGAIQEALNNFGKSQEDIIGDGYKLVTALVENYQTIGKVLMVVTASYGTYRAAVAAGLALERLSVLARYAQIKGTTLLSLATNTLTARVAALNATMMANPYVLLTAGLVALVAATWAYSKANTAAETEQERLNRREQEFSDQLSERKQKIEDNLRVMEDELATAVERQRAFETLKDLMPSVFSQYTTERDLLDKITIARRLSNEELAREKMLKAAHNYSDDNTRLKELREWHALSREYDQTKNYNILTSKRWQYLSKKYNQERLDSKGTFQNTTSSIESMINATLTGMNGKGGTADKARDNAHTQFVARVSAMNETDVKREQAYLQAMLERMRQSGKNYIVPSGEVAPINIEHVQTRLRVVNRQLKTIQENAAKDYLGASRRAWQDAQKQVKNIIAERGDRSKYPTEAKYQEALKKAQDREKEARENYERNGGSAQRSSAKRPETRDSSTKQEAQLRAEAEAKQRLMDAQKQSEFELREKANSREVNEVKRQHQALELEYDRAMHEASILERKWVDELQRASDAAFEAANPDWKKKGLKRAELTAANLSPEQTKIIQGYREDAHAALLHGKAQIYKDVLDRYKTFEEQRADIHRKYAQERADLEAATDEQGNKLPVEVLREKLKVLSQAEKDAIQAVNDAQLNTLSQDNNFLITLFEDTANKSVKEIERIVESTEILVAYLKGKKNEAGEVQHKGQTITQEQVVKLTGLSPADLNLLSSAPERVKALTDAFAKLKIEAKEANPIKSFLKVVKEGLAEIRQGGNDDKGESRTLQGVGKIGQAVKGLVPTLQEGANALAQLFGGGGDEGGSLADELGTAIGLLGDLGNIAEGIGSGNPMEIIQGIASISTKWNEAEQRHQEALRKLAAERLAQQREMNLLLLQQNLELKKSATIFGTDTYAKAVNAVQVMHDAYAELGKQMRGTAEQQAKVSRTGIWGLPSNRSQQQREWAGLADVQIRTGHKKTGLFGLGKGRDVYSSVLEVYPQLISKNGELNIQLAKTILSTRQMSDESKASMQHLIALHEQAEDAWRVTEDYFTGIFGSLGNNLSDALVDAFREGTDASQAFGKSVGEMLAKLAKDMAYSVTLAPIIEQAQEKWLKVAKDNKMPATEKWKQYTSIVDEMTTSALGVQDDFNRMLSDFERQAKEKGVSLTANNSASQSARSGAFTTMTQDQGRKLEGLFTSAQIHWANIDRHSQSISKQVLALGTTLIDIKNDIAYLRYLKNIDERLAKVERDGLKIQ